MSKYQQPQSFHWRKSRNWRNKKRLLGGSRTYREPPIFYLHPFYFYYLVPEFCSSRRHLCALAMAKECPREELFTTSSMQISPYILFKQYVANLHSLFVDSAGATCESVKSVGVFLCPTDFTDLQRFFMPWASSFSLYLSAECSVKYFCLFRCLYIRGGFRR